jgi:hypothetical protein
VGTLLETAYSILHWGRYFTPIKELADSRTIGFLALRCFSRSRDVLSRPTPNLQVRRTFYLRAS